jgi:hypothetical protein
MRPFALIAVLFFSFLLVDPAQSSGTVRGRPFPIPDQVVIVPPRNKCVVSGCNGEVCAADVMNTFCVVPTCQGSCLTRFGTCQAKLDPNAKLLCSWNTSVAEKEYQACLAACKNEATGGPDDGY